MAEITRNMIEAQFYQSLRDCGITPRGSLTLEMDGKIHRFATEVDKHGAKSGAYVIHTDGCPTWGVMDYHRHHEMQKFSFDYSTFTREERREHMKAQDISGMAGTRPIALDPDTMKKKAQAEAQEREARKQAVLKAWREYRYSAWGVDKHPYLELKQVSNAACATVKGRYALVVKQTFSNGDICKPGELLVPLTDIRTGIFAGVQRIYESNGTFKKGFYTGIKTSGCAFEIIPPILRLSHDISPLTDLSLSKRLEFVDGVSEILVAEGMATAFSVLELNDNRKPVLAALSAGNLLSVCKAWRERYPEMKITIAADNDRPQPGEVMGTGEKAAVAVVEAGYADRYVMPPDVGYDWNDVLAKLKEAN